MSDSAAPPSCDDAPSGFTEGCAGGEGGVPTFIQPTLECRDPRPGESPGRAEGGQICTWQALAGATEEGRRFEEYADCGAVYTHRPYFPLPANDTQPTPDPRMEDPDYVSELDWVREQVEATGCSCCHVSTAPLGPSNWFVDAPGNWVNTLHDHGLASVSGWIDVSAFGAYPPEDNNGFDRKYGIPTTDPERMRAFFEAELAHRGRTLEEFADARPAGGPLYDQQEYVPAACTNVERVDRDGTIHWTGGPARYLYVLEAGSGNPTVPPNLDLPAGTRWRIDVPLEGTPLEPGTVRYGELPAGVLQRLPDRGPPTGLVEGTEYYLYVARDVTMPITRCLFTY